MKWKVRRLRHRCIALGIASVIAGTEGTTVVAQTATRTLTVQPRTMATGKQNPAAGEYPLTPDSSVIVSVPSQCVGAKRCPLFLFLPGHAQPASSVIGWLRPVADKYGMILLSSTEYSPKAVDTVLKQTLRRFAIDPAKIAVIGQEVSGAEAAEFGINNSHVFNRVAVISGGLPFNWRNPKNKTVKYLIDVSYQEARSLFSNLWAMRTDPNGQPVRYTLTIRGPEHQAEDYDFLGRWLSESWTKPAAGRTAPTVMDSLLLTTDAVARMTAFWTSFFKEPDSIRNTARRALIRDVIVPIADFQPGPVIPMVDMAALAAKYPSVAAALKQAGLTAQEHDAYRVALISAILTQPDGMLNIMEKSMLAKNRAFVKNHPDELRALENAGIENQDKLSALDGCCINPKQVEQMGPLGIWRTP